MPALVDLQVEQGKQIPSIDTTEGIAAELAKLEPLIKQQQQQQAKSATDRRIAELEALFQKQKAELSAPIESIPSNVPSGMGFYGNKQQIELSPEQKASRLGKMLEIKTQIDTLKQQQKPVEAPAAAKAVTTPESTQAAPQEAPAAPKEQAQPAMTQQFSEFNQLLNRREQTRARAIDYIKKSLPQEQWLDGMKLVDDYSNQFFKIPDNIAQPVLDAVTMRPIEGLVKIGGKVEKIEAPKEETGLTVRGYEGKAPTAQEASKFREYLMDVGPGVDALDQLIELGKKGNKFSPTDRAKAENLARAIQGRFRLEIVGPGAVTENDRKVLESVISNPLQIFTVTDIPSLLGDFKTRMLQNKDSRAEILGLKPAAGAGRSTGTVSGQNAPSGSVLMYNPSSKSFSPAR